MKTTVKRRKKTLKSKLLKVIKKVLNFGIFTFPNVIGKISRTLSKSVFTFIRKNNIFKGILVGDTAEMLGMGLMVLMLLVVLGVLLLPFIWILLYAMYSANPEFWDIILDFTGSLYQYFNK